MTKEQLAAMLVSVRAPPPAYPVDKDGLSVTTVAAGTDVVVELAVTAQQLAAGKDVRLKWDFRTEWGDIDFSVALRPEQQKELQQLLPAQRYDASPEGKPVSGELDVPLSAAGTYMFTFGNAYSWMNAKVVHFKIEVEGQRPDVDSTSAK